MIYTIYLLLFISGIIIIFMTNNLYYLLSFALLTILLMIIKKVSVKSILKTINSNRILLITVLVANIIFMNIIDGLALFIKLLLAIIATVVNKYVINTERLSKCIEDIFFFSKDKKNISLIVTMSISLIPILNKLIHDIKLSLKSRNFNLSIKNIMTQGYIMFITFINQIFKKTNGIELSLISRGFDR